MKCSYKINKCGYKSVKLVWCEDYSNDVDKTINVWFQYNIMLQLEGWVLFKTHINNIVFFNNMQKIAT